MSLTLLRSILRRRPAAAGRVGLVVHDDRASGVVVSRAEPGKPQLLDCLSADGERSLKDLAAWRARGGWARSPANLLLGAAEYQILPIEVDDLPPDELASAARWKVKDLIDYPAEQASVACVYVPGSTEANRSRQALAVVAPRASVADAMRRLLAADFELSSIDIPELALRNLAALVPATAAFGLLHVGVARTTLVMVWQGELCTFRRFELTAGQLIEADTDQRDLLLERLGLDLQRTSDAFERQFYAAGLQPMRVIEEVPGLELAPALSRHVINPVQPLHLRDLLDIAPTGPWIDPAAGIDFVPAIGAALRDDEVPA